MIDGKRIRGDRHDCRSLYLPKVFGFILAVGAVVATVCGSSLGLAQQPLENSACNTDGAATCGDIGNLGCGAQLAFNGSCTGGVCHSCTGPSAITVSICVDGIEGETCTPTGGINCGPKNKAKCKQISQEECLCDYIGPNGGSCGNYPSCS